MNPRFLGKFQYFWETPMFLGRLQYFLGKTLKVLGMIDKLQYHKLQLRSHLQK